jgi:hypothetical protein
LGVPRLLNRLLEFGKVPLGRRNNEEHLRRLLFEHGDVVRDRLVSRLKLLGLNMGECLQGIADQVSIPVARSPARC